MDFLLQLFREHYTFASALVQYGVYITSGLLFLNGLWISLKALRWLWKVDDKDIKEQVGTELYIDDPLIVTVVKAFCGATANHGDAVDPAFVADATRQLAENFFETRFMEPLTMSSNLLPPLGFIGTVFGMILIFLAKVNPGSELNTIGLGAALFTTLAALVLFVILEIIKMWLVRLCRKRIEEGLMAAEELTGS